MASQIAAREFMYDARDWYCLSNSSIARALLPIMLSGTNSITSSAHIML